MTAASVRARGAQRGGSGSTAAVRLAIEVMLGAFACWLVVQNLLLLAFEPWATRPAALVAVAAVLRAGLHLLAAVWPIALFLAVTLVALATALVVRFGRGRGQEVTGD